MSIYDLEEVAGTMVVLANLQRQSLNGSFGIVLHWDFDKGRAAVRLLDGSQLLVKSENMIARYSLDRYSVFADAHKKR